MTTAQAEFIQTIGQACLQYYPTYKILPSMTIAQAIKESNWGKSGLATACFNYYGMKWTSSCGCDYKEYSTKEWNGTGYVTVKAKFRKYASADAGIKGYYDFISGYKRYSNLKGITDSLTACKTIQSDGWATAPSYGLSLYNDYVVPYGLTSWDDMAFAGDMATTSSTVAVTSSYIEGTNYTLQTDLYVRDNADGNKLKYDNLTQNGKKNAYYDQYGNAILKKGTKVTCKGVGALSSSTWIKIPSGWICAVSKNKVYVK